MDHSSHDTVITLWFVTATHPEKVIATMPRADRGFGRKLLSQLNPRWPITPIGQFALNRSAQPSRSEFYIAGFPGLSIIQTVVDDLTMISGIDQALRTAIPAENVYAIATNAGTSYGAFAHWSRGNLKRAFAAVNERVYEDLGLVETFESSYWAGYHTTETSGLTLPFSPIDLALHAQRSWLGFDMATCPDINIVAYAVDGRPEPKITYRQPIDARPLTERTTTKLSLGSTRSNGEFDDYELPDEFDDVDGAGTKYAEEAVALTKKSVTKTKGFAARFRERLAGIGHGLKERLRHTDRPTPQPKKPAALPSAASTTTAAAKEATKDKKKADHASATEAKAAKAAKASESSSAKQTTTKAVSTKSISTTDAIGTDAIANKSTASQGAAQGKDQQSAKTKTAQPATTAATKKPADAADATETIDSQAVKAGVKKAQATASVSKPADKPKEAAQTAKEASVQKAESTGTKPAAAATAKPVASKTTATASAKPVTSKTAAAAADSAKPKATKAPAKTTAKATKATKTATKATKTVKKTTTKAVKRTTKATAKATTKAPETAAFPSSESATAAKPAPKSGIRVPAKSTTSAQKPAPAESPETKAFPAETSPAEDAPQKKRRTLGTRTTRSKKS